MQEFLTVKEVALIFNVHSNTIYTWIKKDFIVSVKIGDKKKSRYRISKKSLDAIHTSIIKEMSKKIEK